MTTTSPGTIFLSEMALLTSSSELKQRAVPSKRIIFSLTAACLTTEPSGARLPKRMAMPPCLWNGLSIGLMHSSSVIRASSAISWTILPDTVSSLYRWSFRRFMMAGTPPARSKSPMTYWPLGLMLVRCGISLENSSNVFRLILIPKSEAIAGRCSAVLVEPPMAMSTRIAFLNESSVAMERGVLFCRASSTILRPDSRAISLFFLLSAIAVPHPTRDRPSASVRQAMVLAVNSPAQLPAPGQAQPSMCSTCSLSVLPALYSPSASNTLCRSRRSLS